MKKILPIFPLNIIVFPFESINLHIFEERYKQLIMDVSQKDKVFCMPIYIDNQIQDYGANIKLKKIDKTYKNGEMDVRCECLGIYHIEFLKKNMDGKLYDGAMVSEVDNNLIGSQQKNEQILELMAALFSILKIQKDIESLDEVFTTYKVLHHLGLSLSQEYACFTLFDEENRQDYILDHLNTLLPVVEEIENLRKRVEMNGHFKKLLPLKYR